jgi:SH3-like domain-containing protein
MKIFKKTIFIFSVFYVLHGISFAETTEKTVIGPSGYPLPRFMSLSQDEAYLRTGPDFVYPIDWIYLKKGYPLKVIAEYGTWRKVVDIDQTTGWISRTLLSLNRSGMIINGTQSLVQSPDRPDKITVIAEENVIGTIVQCQKTLCEMKVGGIEGWVSIKNIWGALQEETFD